MTTPENDAMLAKIRKLLAKAEDPAATAEEAEAYTGKATALIAAYGIDRALLAASDPTSDVVGDRVVILDPPYAVDKGQLLASIASPLRCRTVHRRRYINAVKVLSVHLFGYASDLDRIDLLYTSLLVQAAHGMVAAFVPPWENTAAFRRSWLAGFTTAIARRLHTAEHVARDDAASTPQGSSVALVLADRAVAVRNAIDAAYPRLHTARSRSLTGTGINAGYRAGQTADLGGSNRITPTRRALGQ